MNSGRVTCSVVRVSSWFDANRMYDILSSFCHCICFMFSNGRRDVVFANSTSKHNLMLTTSETTENAHFCLSVMLRSSRLRCEGQGFWTKPYHIIVTLDHLVSLQPGASCSKVELSYLPAEIVSRDPVVRWMDSSIHWTLRSLSTR